MLTPTISLFECSEASVLLLQYNYYRKEMPDKERSKVSLDHFPIYLGVQSD